MNKPIQQRLQTIAKRLSGQQVSGLVGDYRVEAIGKGETLKIIVADIKLDFSDFGLVPREFGKSPYRAISGDVRNYYYSSNVQWQVGKSKGKEKDVILGFWQSREKLSRGMTQVQQAIVSSLLSLIDRTISGLYGTAFLGPRAAVSREYPEDTSKGVRSF